MKNKLAEKTTKEENVMTEKEYRGTDHIIEQLERQNRLLLEKLAERHICEPMKIEVSGIDPQLVKEIKNRVRGKDMQIIDEEVGMIAEDITDNPIKSEDEK